MSEKPVRLGELLVEAKLITRKQLADALKKQRETSEILGDLIIRKGLITEEQLLQALSKQFKLDYIKIESDKVKWDVAEKFLSTRLMEHKCFPMDEDEESITVAISNPLDAWTVSAIEEQARDKTVILVLATKNDIEVAMDELRKRGIQRSRTDFGGDS